MITAFCSTEIELPASRVRLFVDGNGAITAGNGSFAEPAPNAFSLPSPETCPGSTPECREECYVHGLRKAQPEVYAGYERNLAAVRKLLGSAERLPAAGWGMLDAAQRATMAALEFGEWIADHCRGGFRWHVSGDVFSAGYAGWIATVCAASPRVTHWIYTRTLGLVSTLARVPNLVVNVSADSANYYEARVVAEAHGLRVCYLARPGAVEPPGDMHLGDVLFPAYALRGRDRAVPTEAPWWGMLDAAQRGMVCPKDFAGQSEVRRCVLPGQRGCSRCARKAER